MVQYLYCDFPSFCYSTCQSHYHLHKIFNLLKTIALGTHVFHLQLIPLLFLTISAPFLSLLLFSTYTKYFLFVFFFLWLLVQCTIQLLPFLCLTFLPVFIFHVICLVAHTFRMRLAMIYGCNHEYR